MFFLQIAKSVTSLPSSSFYSNVFKVLPYLTILLKVSTNFSKCSQFLFFADFLPMNDLVYYIFYIQIVYCLLIFQHINSMNLGIFDYCVYSLMPETKSVPDIRQRQIILKCPLDQNCKIHFNEIVYSDLKNILTILYPLGHLQ